MVVENTQRARFNMVEQQIRPWEVFDPRVLELLTEIPRETFVPDAYRGLAYADIEIPLPNGQCMLYPRLEAKILESLALTPETRVLEIGTGSGFLSACLASLAGRVTSLEIDQELSSMASTNLEKAGIRNVELLTGDLFTTELPARGFDAIAITGSLPELPEFVSHLLDDGGRIFVVLGEEPIMQAMRIDRNSDGSLSQKVLFDTVIQPLITPTQKESFDF